MAAPAHVKIERREEDHETQASVVAFRIRLRLRPWRGRGRRAGEVQPALGPLPRRRPLRAAREGLRSRDRKAHQRPGRSEEHTSELQSPCNLVCRLLLEKKK